MNRASWRRGLFIVGATMAGLMLVVLFVQATAGRAAEYDDSTGTLSRVQNPVTITGAELPAFDGVPLTELVLYHYQNTVWEPVPFQFDEVTAGGTYTVTEDGLLDGNDELVFMAFDGGEGVDNSIWPDDFQSRLHPRQAITVTDPLSGNDLGRYYLYHSVTLPQNSDTYVQWDEPAQFLTGISYTLEFETDSFFGVSNLTLNGQPADILDRQKLRGQATVLLGGFPISTTSFTEESITQLITQRLTVTLPIIGPIRAVGGDNTVGYAFYGTEANLMLSLPLADIPIAPLTVVHFDFLRMSLDLLDPAGSGFAPARYYDSNGADVAIDGVADAVPADPPVNWTQTTGAYGGWVSVNNINPAAGTLANYYLDDNTPDPDDTGDGVSYGDTGFRVDDPNGTVDVGQQLVFLPAGVGNVGAAVSLWAGNPLMTRTAIEIFESSEAFKFIYMPLVLNQE